MRVHVAARVRLAQTLTIVSPIAGQKSEVLVVVLV